MPDPSYEDLARGALLEITPAATIGTLVSETAESDGSITVRFTSTQPGYPDWLWTVSVADVEGGPATVLEAELLPGEGSLLSPDWVPWSDRLAEYKAAQEALDGVVSDDDEDPDDDESDAPDDESDDEDDDLGDDDDDDLDDHVLDDDDVLGSDVLHGGDLDGVDIDDLDEDDDSDDDGDADDSDDDDSDDDGERTY